MPLRATFWLAAHSRSGEVSRRQDCKLMTTDFTNTVINRGNSAMRSNLLEDHGVACGNFCGFAPLSQAKVTIWILQSLYMAFWTYAYSRCRG